MVEARVDCRHQENRGAGERRGHWLCNGPRAASRFGRADRIGPHLDIMTALRVRTSISLPSSAGERPYDLGATANSTESVVTHTNDRLKLRCGWRLGAGCCWGAKMLALRIRG